MMGQATRHQPLMVFDWNQAARIIKEKNVTYAEAGLAGDWACTGGAIWNDGPVCDSYTYLVSTWATPQILIDGCYRDCYTMDSDWDEHTKWPESALNILGRKL